MLSLNQSPISIYGNQLADSKKPTFHLTETVNSNESKSNQKFKILISQFIQARTHHTTSLTRTAHVYFDSANSKEHRSYLIFMEYKAST